jgi:hypothetical protein
MAPLNIHPEDDRAVTKKKNNKVLKVLLGISALIAVPVIGTTLAASITINTNTAVQFGQGVVQATACDSTVTVSSTTSFTNSSGAGSFKIATIVLTDIANACSTYKFKVMAYGDTGNALTLSSGGTANACVATPTLVVGGNTISSEGSNNCVGTVNATNSATANTITFTPATVLDASTVFKFTVETLNA